MRRIYFIILFILFPCYLFAQDGFFVEKAIKEITLTGYTRSKTTMTISSEVAGKIINIHYDIGQTIGDKPFCEIDPTFIDFQIKSAQHAIDNLKISHKRTLSKANFLNKEFKRVNKLFKEGSAHESKKDLAFENLEQAQLEKGAVAIQIAKSETVLQELIERKNRHTIHAPSDNSCWVVNEKFVEEGEIIQQGTPLAKISDYQDLIVPFSVTSNELDTIKALPEEFDAYLEEKPVKASIEWINPKFNSKTRKLNIELALRNYHGEKRGGLMFSLPLNVETQGFIIPKGSVVNHYENPVITIKKTGKKIQILILGEANDHFVIAENPQLVLGMELK